MKYWHFALTCLIGISSIAVAQTNSNLDSLESLLPQTQGIEKMAILGDLSWGYFYDDINKSASFSIQEIQLAKQLQNDSLLAIAYNDHGRSLYGLYQFDSAIYFYELAIPISKRLNDSLNLAKLYNKTAIAFQLFGNYDLAIQNYFLAIQYFDGLHLDKNVNMVRGNIAALMTQQENYLGAIKLHKKTLAYNRISNDSMDIYYSLNGLASAYHELKQYDSAIIAYKEGIEITTLLNDTAGMAAMTHNLGALYLITNQLPLANKYLHLALQLRNHTNDLSGLISTNTSLGKYFYKIHDFKKSKFYLTQAKKIADDIGGAYDFEIIFQYLAELHYELGDLDSAYRYQVLYTETRDSIRSEQVYQQIADAEAKFQVSEKEKALLLAENQKSQAEFIILEKNRQLWFSFGGATILLLIGSFLFYRTKQKQKSKEATIRIEEQQKGLAAVIQVQEDERKRIAKDLHDGIVQQLSGLKLGLQKVFSGNESDETSKLVKTLDDSAQELRELSHKMMPRSLSELGLIPALKDMLENSLGHSNIEFQFEHFGINSRFKENLEIAIYRIAQELINNVIKHSNARKVNVQLFKNGTFVMLIVEDDGKGISLTEQKDGIGLMNISSRLDTLNGKVNFEPSPKSGTLATVKIPVE